MVIKTGPDPLFSLFFGGGLTLVSFSATFVNQSLALHCRLQKCQVSSHVGSIAHRCISLQRCTTWEHEEKASMLISVDAAGRHRTIVRCRLIVPCAYCLMIAALPEHLGAKNEQQGTGIFTYWGLVSFRAETVLPTPGLWCSPTTYPTFAVTSVTSGVVYDLLKTLFAWIKRDWGGFLKVICVQLCGLAWGVGKGKELWQSSAFGHLCQDGSSSASGNKTKHRLRELGSHQTTCPHLSYSQLAQ
eukprot:475634-Amphidinium_carterae.1